MALIGASFSAHANNWNMPWNNNNGFNNGSNWSMPNFNWGNNGTGFNNGFNNGSNWSMPNFNWGNGNRGSNWSMPSMNWGNNNGYGNGSNWSMPNFNWNNNNQPWGYGANRYYNNGYVPGYSYAPRIPNRQYTTPQRPAAPQFVPRFQQPKIGQQPHQSKQQIKKPARMPQPNMAMPKQIPQKAMSKAPQQAAPQVSMHKAMPKKPNPAHIPMPHEVKGVILAPENQPKSAETPKK